MCRLQSPLFVQELVSSLLLRGGRSQQLVVVPTQASSWPSALKLPPSQEWHCKAEVLLTFSSCMVNSLPCSLALFIMKSRASLWSSGLFLCSFSCIAFSINLCSMSRALIPCERHTQFRRTLGTAPLSRETRGTQV